MKAPPCHRFCGAEALVLGACATGVKDLELQGVLDEREGSCDDGENAGNDSSDAERGRLVVLGRELILNGALLVLILVLVLLVLVLVVLVLVLLVLVLVLVFVLDRCRILALAVDDIEVDLARAALGSAPIAEVDRFGVAHCCAFLGHLEDIEAAQRELCIVGGLPGELAHLLEGVVLAVNFDGELSLRGTAVGSGGSFLSRGDGGASEYERASQGCGEQAAGEVIHVVSSRDEIEVKNSESERF
ncbi:hypothetical protein CJ201_10725 [Corynebacterium aurimucosum]|nr:hypothetical protein CJ201_10725 [Corynebacterium aurimucosum]